MVNRVEVWLVVELGGCGKGMVVRSVVGSLIVLRIGSRDERRLTRYSKTAVQCQLSN